MVWDEFVKSREKSNREKSVSRLLVFLSVMVAREKDYFRAVRACGAPNGSEESEGMVNRVDSLFYRLLCSIADLKNECELFGEVSLCGDFPFSINENYRNALLCNESGDEDAVVDIVQSALAVAEIVFACSRGAEDVIERFCDDGFVG